MNSPDKPDFIITSDAKLYKFHAWYVFSINCTKGSQWIGAQVSDKDGNNFGVPASKIILKIYHEKDSNNM